MKKTILLFLGVFSIIGTNAQVTIGSNEKPARAGILELKTNEADTDNVTSKSGGLILPRVKLVALSTLEPFIPTTDTDWTNAAKQAELKKSHIGLVAYNMTNNATFKPGQYTWDGSNWIRSGAAITADNGLTKTGDNIQLGGTLTQATTINQNNNSLAITTGASGNLNINSNKLVVTNTGVGIGTATPGTKMEINGANSLKYTDGFQGLGQQLLSRADGTAYWGAPGGLNIYDFVNGDTYSKQVNCTFGTGNVVESADGSKVFKITFPSHGVYQVNLLGSIILTPTSGLLSDYALNVFLMLVPGRNGNLWTAATPRFRGATQVPAPNANPNRIAGAQRMNWFPFALINTIRVDATTGLDAYLIYHIDTPTMGSGSYNTSIQVGHIAGSWVSEGSWLKIN